jgi:uncharacterized protein YbaP (TraB family)
LPDEQTLQTVLDEATYNRLAEQCKKLSFPIGNAMNLKPGMLLNSLTIMQMQQFGFTPQGLDAYYLSKAAEAGKETGFLETVEQQIDMLTGMGEGYENEYARYMLDDWDKMEESIPELIETMKSGTFDLLLPDILSMKEQFPSVYKTMLSGRNHAWIPQLEAYFTAQTPAFIIVGLAHLPGEDGLLELLKNKDYDVKQLSKDAL